MNLWEMRDFGPMLLTEIKKPFNSSDYLYELKFDGARTIIFASPQKVYVQSRGKTDVTRLYPELQEIKNIVKNDTIFDGEIVAFDNGFPSFKKLQKRMHLKDAQKIKHESIKNPIIFMCFDILYLKKDVTALPLTDRKKILQSVPENDVFLKVKEVEDKGIPFFKEVKKLNLEGIVAKKKDSVYEINTRSVDWLKIKNLKQEAFLIYGYIEKEKNAVVSLILGEIKRNKKYYIGKVTMAKKNPLYQKLKKEPNLQKSPFPAFQEQAHFLRPKYSCLVEYLEKTEKGELRHPVFLKEVNPKEMK